MPNKNTNPLRALWNTLGTIGGIISLSSMIQNWADDLFKWKGFIRSLMTGYEAIIRPFFSFIFGWLPIDVPFWLHDYLVFGTIVAIAEYRVFKIYVNYSREPGLEWSFRRRLWKHTDSPLRNLVNMIVIALSIYPLLRSLSVLLFWPLTINFYLYLTYFGFRLKRHQKFLIDNPQFGYARSVISWVGAIFLGCTVLMSINAVQYG